MPAKTPEALARQRAQQAVYRAAHKTEAAERRAANKDKAAAYRAAYNANHKAERKATNAKYSASHKNEIAARAKAYRASEHGRALKSEYNTAHYNGPDRAARSAALKLAALNAYGGPVCACCGETLIQGLSIDHIAGDGAKHRREMSSKMLYGWLKANGYPPGYQVLCMTCNFAKGDGPICPHQLVPKS